MKYKKLFIIILLFILIIVCSTVFISVFYRKKEVIITNSIVNPYEEFKFYKRDNLDRYVNYHNNNNLSNKDVVLRVNINLDNPFYTNIKEVNTFSTTMIVNKYNYVSKDYTPDNLVKLDKFYVKSKELYLNKECLDAFYNLAENAKNNNLNIEAVSTYRTYEYQEKLYNNYANRDGISKADTYSARPGYSEHHTGLAIDVDNISKGYMEFENTDEFNWMQENAYKFGFILRYPKDKTNITGYIYEPWHYRYVGTSIATYIHEHNITYEEYYYEFIDI